MDYEWIFSLSLQNTYIWLTRHTNLNTFIIFFFVILKLDSPSCKSLLLNGKEQPR